MQVHLSEAERSGAAVKSFDSPCFLSHAQENDITWGYLLTMEKEDLEKVEDDCNICVSVSGVASESTQKVTKTAADVAATSCVERC